MLRKLSRDLRGVAATEFAMLAPPLILLISGSIEAAHFIMVKTALEGAVTTAARETAAKLTLNETERDTQMRARITSLMAPHRPATGRSVSITTTVYRSIGDSYPEGFEDLNNNGSYDEGEPYDDRNRNGKRDLSAAVAGKLGDVGDVVRYTVVYPTEPYFGLMKPVFGDRIDLSTDVVTRNEPEQGVVAS